MDQLTEVKAKQAKVITVAFGPYANLRQLKDIDDEADVLHFGENESFKRVGKGLLHSKYPNNTLRSSQNDSYWYTLEVIYLSPD